MVVIEHCEASTPMDMARAIYMKSIAWPIYLVNMLLQNAAVGGIATSLGNGAAGGGVRRDAIPSKRLC